MAYYRPPTMTTGDFWTAQKHNKYFKDNFEENIPAKMTAKGDIVGGAAADDGAILSVGKDFDGLWSNTAETLACLWGRPPVSLVTLSNDFAMSVSSAGYEGFIEWDNAVLDDWEYWDGTSRKYTIKFGDMGIIGYSLRIKNFSYDGDPLLNWQLSSYIQEVAETGGGNINTASLGQWVADETRHAEGALAFGGVTTKSFQMLQYRQKISEPTAVARITDYIYPMSWDLDKDFSFFFAVTLGGE